MSEPTLYQIDQLADDEDRPQEVWQDRGLGYKEFVGVLVPVEPDSYMMACWETGTIEPMKHCTNLYMSGPKLKPRHQQCQRLAVFKAGIGDNNAT